MAEFSRLVITDAGQALLAKMIAGSGNIRFTKVSTSEALYEEEQLQGLTVLSEVRQTSTISKVARTNDTAIEIEASFTNGDLAKGYYLRALGIYTVDPDAGEILYAAAKEMSGGCYMPAYNGATMSGIMLTLVTTVGNAESVSLEVNPAGIATLRDVQDVQQDIQEVKAQLGENTVESDVPANAIFSNMVGATETAAGQAGYVPAPVAGAQGKYLRGDGTWQPVIESLEDVKANTQSGYIAGALALKKVIGTTLTEILAAGATTLTFTSDAITDDSMIDIYTDPFCSGLTAVQQDESTLTLTFDAQEVDMRVRVEVR